jgi:hypothetical protein
VDQLQLAVANKYLSLLLHTWANFSKVCLNNKSYVGDKRVFHFIAIMWISRRGYIKQLSGNGCLWYTDEALLKCLCSISVCYKTDDIIILTLNVINKLAFSTVECLWLGKLSHSCWNSSSYVASFVLDISAPRNFNTKKVHIAPVSSAAKFGEGTIVQDYYKLLNIIRFSN